LGYTFGRMYSPTTGKARLGYRPSKKSIKRMVERVHALTDRAGSWQETTEPSGGTVAALHPANPVPSREGDAERQPQLL
jgi:hypothetical protein